MHFTQFDHSFTTNPAAPFCALQPRPSTFAEIVAAEPRIADLIREATLFRSSRRVTWRDYGEYKARVKALVGWHARRSELQNSDAYDLVLCCLVAALGV